MSECHLIKAVACFDFFRSFGAGFLFLALRKSEFGLLYLANGIEIFGDDMTHCEIQFHPSTGQMMVVPGRSPVGLSVRRAPRGPCSRPDYWASLHHHPVR